METKSEKITNKALDRGFDIFIKVQLLLCILALLFEVHLVIEYQDIHSLLLLILGLGFLAVISMLNLTINLLFVVPYYKKKLKDGEGNHV